MRGMQMRITFKFIFPSHTPLRTKMAAIDSLCWLVGSNVVRVGVVHLRLLL